MLTQVMPTHQVPAEMLTQVTLTQVMLTHQVPAEMLTQVMPTHQAPVGTLILATIQLDLVVMQHPVPDVKMMLLEIPPEIPPEMQLVVTAAEIISEI
jgi:hypothetical protein